jgi:hypothetical protein
MRDKVAQDMKDLGPELDRLVSAREFVALSIEEVVAKNVTHGYVLLALYTVEEPPNRSSIIA